MMKKKFSFRKRLYCSVVAILSLFAVCSNSLYATNNGGPGEILMDVNDSQRNAQEAKVGEQAPDFTLMKDGKSVKISDIRISVALCFTSSAPECSKFNADVATMQEKYKTADIVFVSIPIEQYADVAKLYGISSVPAVCLIHPHGIIASIESGDIDLTKRDW